VKIGNFPVRFERPVAGYERGMVWALLRSAKPTRRASDASPCGRKSGTVPRPSNGTPPASGADRAASPSSHSRRRAPNTSAVHFRNAPKPDLAPHLRDLSKPRKARAKIGWPDTNMARTSPPCSTGHLAESGRVAQRRPDRTQRGAERWQIIPSHRCG
jgi:hypothetical protein